MLSDFTICGFQHIALSVRGDSRTLNGVGSPKDYEENRKLNVFSSQDERETIMTRATMQLIETKKLLERMISLNAYLSCLVSLWIL